MKIVFLGSGNVATHLAKALHAAGHRIIQVFSRSQENATLLADKVGAEAVSRLHLINTEADLYLFSVKDDALQEVILQMPQTKGVWAHTAGSLPMTLFSSRKEEYGVIYPLQTFGKNRELNFIDIPLFIEGSTPATVLFLENLARYISREVHQLPGEKRRYLHLAAVFACNFVNHMYTLSSDILLKEDIPFAMLRPLIAETMAKVTVMTPREAQTGPAVRNDEEVMRNHLELITHPQLKELYTLISKSISSL
ncbi:MAG: DUF2520 domain-containing protein [Proteiniphilum sp.]|nr:DUF2520 domain-containing protein [Proteiniphilum sp.]